MKKNIVIIPLIFLLTGFVSAYFIFNGTTQNNLPSAPSKATALGEKSGIINPFTTRTDNFQDNERLAHLENEIILIKKQLKEVNLSLQKSAKTSIAHPETINKNRSASVLTQRLYNLDNLIRGGINASLAEDIVRRKNSIQLERLALQDRAMRENYLNTQQYFDELSEIDKQGITLREELGDEQYDAYLFTSKQNNRIRISSVMLGSAAEQAGIQKGDIILSYDNNRLFNWQELKNATSEGQLGEYVSISIYRKGEIFSFSVPRGPLGMQLGAARLAP